MLTIASILHTTVIEVTEATTAIVATQATTVITVTIAIIATAATQVIPAIVATTAIIVTAVIPAMVTITTIITTTTTSIISTTLTTITMLLGNILGIIPCMIGTTELILIGALVLLLFGGKKLPELMKGLGQGIRSFKQGMNEPVKEGNPTIDNEVKLPEESESETK